MEGTLQKWTNVVQGWQLRHFYLDETAGILSYYTAKEKMRKGQRRGCIRLRGAICGIEDEDEVTFTITVDGKVFHLQGRDGDERERWVRALEIVIHRISGYYRPSKKGHSAKPINRQDCIEDFNRRIKEADMYLQLMINNVQKIRHSASRSTDCANDIEPVLQSATDMISTIKHAIVLMQMAKSELLPGGSPPIVVKSTSTEDSKKPDLAKGCAKSQSYFEPPTSFSSSEDEDEFLDATETLYTSDEDRKKVVKHRSVERTGSIVPSLEQQASSADELVRDQCVAAVDDNIEGLEPEPDFKDDNVDFDKLYADSEEQELGDVQKDHGSIIMHLLSQVSIGMDLTKIPLPTFILERRSLLEMYADFFAHPDLFVGINDGRTPEHRMIAAVKWYLSSMHGGRRSSVAKKPYNPIIGETFKCYWDVPNREMKEIKLPANVTNQTPFPGSNPNQLTFIAEQVSHHPPISAFYAEHLASKVQCQGHIWTKSKFLGLSIGVHMVGQGCITLIDHQERYVATFPSGYGRSILTKPWVELGGQVLVKCQETGFRADIAFHTKPFYGGKPHQITAEVYRPSQQKPFLTITGLWNGEMTYKFADTKESGVFLDVAKMPLCEKKCSPVLGQNDMESRKLWRHVTYALHNNDIESASKGKHWLEQRQRLQAKQRATRNEKWQTKAFEESGESWLYKKPLEVRLRDK